MAGHAQEVDLRTGKVLFDWDSLDHVALDETHQAVAGAGTPTQPFDYFHINSIAEDADGNLLISARNTWTVYKVDRESGRVLWRLNGKKSDFTMGAGSHFYWQHDARAPASGTITLFDDGASPAEEKQSRALVLAVDTKSMHVRLAHSYLHPAGFLAANQGSTQLLADGRVFVGWGNQPYFSEFAPDGTLLLDGQMPLNIQSYRAFAHDWAGRPAGAPVAAVLENPAGGVVAYASWNGATDISTWTVLAGPPRRRPRPRGLPAVDRVRDLCGHQCHRALFCCGGAGRRWQTAGPLGPGDGRRDRHRLALRRRVSLPRAPRHARPPLIPHWQPSGITW